MPIWSPSFDSAKQERVELWERDLSVGSRNPGLRRRDDARQVGGLGDVGWVVFLSKCIQSKNG